MDRFIKYTFAVIGIILGLLLLWVWRQPLLSAAGVLVGGMTVAFLSYPLTALLERRIKRGIAAALTVLIVILAITGLLVVVVPVFARQIRDLIDRMPSYLSAMWTFLRSLDDWLTELGLGAPMDSLALDPARMSAVIGGFVARIPGMAGSMTSVIARIFLVPVVAVYLLRDRQAIFERLQLLLPASKRPMAIRAGKAARRVLATYVRGQITVSLITGTLTAIALAFVGLDGYLVLGAGMAVFNLIPVFGPFLGAVPALIVAAASMRLSTVLITAACIFGVQQFESAFVTPRVIGQGSGLHPVAIIMALLVGGGVGGVMGMLFAVPVVLIVRAAWRAANDEHFSVATPPPRKPHEPSRRKGG